MMEWYDWELFFPLYQKEFFGDINNMEKATELIEDIGDVWGDSSDKTINQKRLKK